jgi:hypothetical protein
MHRAIHVRKGGSNQVTFWGTHAQYALSYIAQK